MKYLILGAGPAGLTVAAKLKQHGEDSFLILEKENEAGGLCRSRMVDGAPFDIGGGHFLDVRRPKVNEFLFLFMSENEWNIYDRNSQIKLHDFCLHHPLEANIWELPEDIQREYLDSVSNAGSNLGLPMPETFVEWIRWKNFLMSVMKRYLKVVKIIRHLESNRAIPDFIILKILDMEHYGIEWRTI